MIALGAWLKQIILIVLLAVFTDLLLPSKSMQKYVRTVMGLAIIAAMLQPALPLMKRDWADRLAASALNEVTATNATESVSTNGQSSGSPVTAAEVRNQLTQQAMTDAERLLAEQFIADLQANMHVIPKSLSIALDSNGKPQALTVSISGSDAAKLGEIQSYLAQAASISKANVHVSFMKGGDASGP